MVVIFCFALLVACAGQQAAPRGRQHHGGLIGWHGLIEEFLGVQADDAGAFERNDRLFEIEKTIALDFFASGGGGEGGDGVNNGGIFVYV